MNWKRTALLTGLTTVSLVAGAYAIQAHAKYTQFNERLSMLGGVTIGESRENLLYAKGKPSFVGKMNTEEDMIDASTLPQEHVTSDRYPVWSWIDEDRAVDVQFDQSGRVVSIGCSTNKNI
jgi:hypothetical protein